jgi:hypothetical protein
MHQALGRLNKSAVSLQIRGAPFWHLRFHRRRIGGTDPPAVVYTYAPGRGAVHALKLLDHYRG